MRELVACPVTGAVLTAEARDGRVAAGAWCAGVLRGEAGEPCWDACDAAHVARWCPTSSAGPRASQRGSGDAERSV
jgi:hypothetical protein